MQTELLIGETQTATVPPCGSFALECVGSPRVAEAPACQIDVAPKSADALNVIFTLATYAIPVAGVGALACSLFLGSDRLASYGLITTLAGCALGGLAHDDE